MSLFDFLKKLTAPVRATKLVGLNEIKHDEKPHLDPHPQPYSAPIFIPDPSVRETIPVSTPPTKLPQRFGTFLLVDLYPGDLGGKPDWSKLEFNSKIGNCEVVGAILKATEGTSYAYTPWFVKNVQALIKLYGARRGQDRFIGAYHFLQLAKDGKAQAEYFVKTCDQAGLLRTGDLRPMLDFEQGGQNNFFPTDCPKDKEGHYELHLLPDSKKRDLVKRAIETTTACAERFFELTGIRPLLYGRGLQRDLGMTTARGYTVKQLRMGCVGAWNPAYTEHIPPMDAYGFPIDQVPLWQYGGDGDSAHPKLPSQVPGFGAVDLSVHINGAQRTSLDTFRRDLVI